MTRLTVELCSPEEDGPWYLDVVMTNCGWQEDHYLSTFEFGGVIVQSKFRSEYHTRETCPTPDQRYAFDIESLETSILLNKGSPVCDVTVHLDDDIIRVFDPTIPAIDRMRRE